MERLRSHHHPSPIITISPSWCVSLVGFATRFLHPVRPGLCQGGPLICLSSGRKFTAGRDHQMEAPESQIRLERDGVQLESAKGSGEQSGNVFTLIRALWLPRPALALTETLKPSPPPGKTCLRCIHQARVLCHSLSCPPFQKQNFMRRIRVHTLGKQWSDGAVRFCSPPVIISRQQHAHLAEISGRLMRGKMKQKAGEVG